MARLNKDENTARARDLCLNFLKGSDLHVDPLSFSYSLFRKHIPKESLLRNGRKTLVFFSGEFAPPHAAHFWRLYEEIFKKPEADFRVIVQRGTRHSIGYYAVLRIWLNFYIPFLKERFPDAEIEIFEMDQNPLEVAPRVFWNSRAFSSGIILVGDQVNPEQRSKFRTTRNWIGRDLRYRFFGPHDKVSDLEVRDCLKNAVSYPKNDWQQHLKPCSKYFPNEFPPQDLMEIMEILAEDISKNESKSLK
jgi:hypothetical protein